NASAASAAFSLTIDTKAPAAPPAPTLLAGDDSGVVGDGITNVNRPRLTGSAEAGSTVKLLIAGSVVGSGVASGGTYTIQLNAALADGTYSVTATATDAAGNVSAAGPAFVLTIDTATPAAPSVPSLLAADDSGAAGDGITNVDRPRLTGTAATGATVRLYVAGTLIGTGVATGGVYTIQPSAAFADGTYSVTATATDAAGNVSVASGPLSLTIDTTAPAAPAVPSLLASDDSGAVGDGITNINWPHITGTAAAGSMVRLYIGGSLAGTAVATGGAYAIQPALALADGTYSVTATATDVAGNTSSVSAAFSLTIDSTAPASPSTPALLAADDSGAVGDGITNVSAPRLTGSAAAGSTVRLYIGTTLPGSGTATGGTYTIAVSPALADGTYAITATATDAAGNTSAPSAAFSLTIDTKAPAAPTLGLYAADDSGTVGDGITNVNRPRFTGSAEANATVNLTIAGASVGTGIAAGGTYTILLHAALADGIYLVTATATDAAGNVSAASPPVSLTIDTTAPAAPAATGLVLADDSGAVGDGITNVTGPRLTGTAEAGATVKLLIGGAVVGTGTATGGTYTIQLAAALADGTYSVTATATDAAGNISPASPSFALTIDTAIPPAPTLAIVAADRAVVMSDGTTQDHHIRVTGLAVPGSYVQLLDTAGNVVAGAMASNPGGAYTITTPTVLVGSFTYRTRVEDVAGNIGPASPPMAIQVLSTQGDFLGDGYADLITYDAFDEVWSILSPATGATTQVSFGLPNAVPVPADYNGDGKTDLAVFQPSTGVWLIRNSADGTLSRYTFGGPGDIPVPDDYTGVGHAEVAVYRPSTAQWFVSDQATGAVSVWTFGFPGQSIPVPADYDGEGATDLGVYVPATGGWYIRNTTSGAVSHTVLGGIGFKPVPADYDGVGRADIAVYAPATSQWRILSATTGTERDITYGGAYVDVPVPGDYNGDGTTDLAMYWAVGSQFGLDLSQSGTKQTWTLGRPALDEPGVVPGSYLVTEVALAWNVTPAAIPPLPLPQPAARTTPAPPAAARVAAAPSVAVAPSRPRGNPVAQAIEPGVKSVT
ncbi:MAG TPA: Ig-like domain-containing protein, partial [Isosphaeraceae bacterium]|nr:Ig-like domain-containing protein [Isosphaeraceae bacterium]